MKKTCFLLLVFHFALSHARDQMVKTNMPLRGFSLSLSTTKMVRDLKMISIFSLSTRLILKVCNRYIQQNYVFYTT